MPEPLRRAAPALPAWQQVAVYATAAWLELTGIALVIVGSTGADNATDWVGTAWTPRLLMMHGVGAYLSLLVTGSLWSLHMKAGWRVRRNRLTGTLMGIWLMLLAASGLWLYYAGLAGRATVSQMHWIVGVILIPLMAWHVWRGWRSRHSAPAQT